MTAAVSSHARSFAFSSASPTSQIEYMLSFDSQSSFPLKPANTMDILNPTSTDNTELDVYLVAAENTPNLSIATSCRVKDMEPQISPSVSSPSSSSDSILEEPTLTDSEREYLIDEVREKGYLKFWNEYVVSGLYSPQQLYSIFNKDLTHFPEMSEDQFLSQFSTQLNLFLRNRPRLANVSTIEMVIKLLKRCSNIIILSGAGISVNSGIPDFRSQNGIYSRLDDYELEDPTEMFDLEFFRYNPVPFYKFAKEIYPFGAKPTPSHFFIYNLEKNGKLLRNYTQNIDNLEHQAGIHNVLQCHGSFATASCIECGYKILGNDIKEYIDQQDVPYCPVCPEDHETAIMKPDITFFGEKLSNEFETAFKKDLELADLLIIMGSSLKVKPVSDIPGLIPHKVPQIFINKEYLSHVSEHVDVVLLGDSDTITKELCSLANMELVDSEGECLIDHNFSCKYVFCPPNIYLFEGAISNGVEIDINTFNGTEEDLQNMKKPRSIRPKRKMEESSEEVALADNSEVSFELSEPVLDSDSFSVETKRLKSIKKAAPTTLFHAQQISMPSSEYGKFDDNVDGKCKEGNGVESVSGFGEANAKGDVSFNSATEIISFCGGGKEEEEDELLEFVREGKLSPEIVMNAMTDAELLEL